MGQNSGHSREESEHMSERTYLGENGGRSLTSRRGFLSGSAKLLGGGALALVLGAAPAIAKGNDDDDKKQGGKRNNGGGVSDVDILNYALVLEAVMNSISNGLGMRNTGTSRKPNRPWNPHFYA